MSDANKFTMKETEVTTTVIATKPELDRCLKQMLSSITAVKPHSKRVVGLGVEKKFETIYNGGPKVVDRVALLTLCHGRTCLIIQLHLMSLPPFSLSAFLQRPEISIVGVGIKHSLEALETEYGIRSTNATDLAQLAASVKKHDQFRAFGLFDLYHQVCGLDPLEHFDETRVSDSYEVALGDWGVTALSKTQIQVATWTSFMCFYVGNCLLGGYLPSERDYTYDDYF